MTLAPSGLYTFYPFPNVEEEVNLNNQDYTLKYTYSSAGVAVAVRTKAKQGTTTTNTLHYLYSDHLGSTSTVTNSSGGQVQQTRFLPFGGYWGTPTQTVTDRGYTGHLHNDEVGLIYMNARFYVPSIGRFASADTIVPNPTNPQAFNRYSYVKNNPLNRVDPTGHVDCGMLGDEGDSAGCEKSKQPPKEVKLRYIHKIKSPIWVRPFLDNIEWVQYYGATMRALGYYSSTGDVHPGLDAGVWASTIGDYDVKIQRWDYSTYGTEDNPLIPIYAGCYCKVKDQNFYTERDENGEIIKKNYYAGLTILTHDDYPGVELYYGHLFNMASFEAGTSLTPDTILGYIKAPETGGLIEKWDLHVHIEVRINGEFVNPLPYLAPSLQATYLDAYYDYTETSYQPGSPNHPLFQPNGKYR
jgi:RHS repeat-associated protein